MPRRTKTELGRDLIEFLRTKSRPFFKTELENIGMNSKTAEDWLALYLMFQNGPLLRRLEMERAVVYEIVTKKSSQKK